MEEEKRRLRLPTRKDVIVANQRGKYYFALKKASDISNKKREIKILEDEIKQLKFEIKDLKVKKFIPINYEQEIRSEREDAKNFGFDEVIENEDSKEVQQ